MQVGSPDDSNPLLLPEMVSVFLSLSGVFAVIAVLAAFHWLA